MKKVLFPIQLALVLLLLSMTSCLENTPNLNEQGVDIFEAQTIDEIPENVAHKDTTYVSIYSDIYSETKNVRFNLTATLSLRNTSFTDNIYVTHVDYYDSKGTKVRQYLDKPILLKPMQSMEYVIEEEDSTGGTGANFIVIWAADSKNARPLFEGIMISTNGQQGISFSTQGVSISKSGD